MVNSTFKILFFLLKESYVVGEIIVLFDPGVFLLKELWEACSVRSCREKILFEKERLSFSLLN